MRMRVVDEHGETLRLGRAVLRFVGILLAIVPLFAGFLPILFAPAPSGLQD